MDTTTVEPQDKTKSQPLTRPVHDRMPAILDERAAEDWMNPREEDPRSLKRLLAPAPDDLLLMQPASPLVNSVKNEGPELLEMKGQLGDVQITQF